ncbi:MAG TPA: hypothetical protein IAA39_07990 [Candidatus Olsenella avistercoris]|nr:hypothetical protein [Candidatus Olsenella avistercoris]
MPRMREPFTGGVFDVPASKVEKYLGRGYALLDGEPEPAHVDDAPDERPTETPVATTDEPKPTAESTIAEIRAWAKANGVALPKRGNKAALLAAIE